MCSGCVLADAGCGMSASFHHALSARGLSWAVGVPGRQKVYPVDVTMIFPVSGHGRPRQHHIPDIKPLAAEKLLLTSRYNGVAILLSEIASIAIAISGFSVTASLIYVAIQSKQDLRHTRALIQSCELRLIGDFRTR
jgi:hypothetical protein